MKQKIKTILKLSTITIFIWFFILYISHLIMLSRVPVSLPTSMNVFSYDDSYAVAEGTWVIENEKSAYPLQTSKIICSRQTKICTVATAKVFNSMLFVDNDSFGIAEWNRGRIVFLDDSPSCVTYIYTIDTLTKSVQSIRQKRKEPKHTSDSCEGMSLELRSSLKKGFQIGDELQQEAIPWFGKIALAPFKLFN